jgi:hypothetical protein
MAIKSTNKPKIKIDPKYATPKGQISGEGKLSLKWEHTRKKVILEDGTSATRDTYSAKGKKNEYLFIRYYHKGEINTYSDILFVNGNLKYNFLSVGLVVMDRSAKEIEQRQIASAKKRLEAKKNAPAKSKEVITEKETKKTGRKNIYTKNGRKFKIDENKAITKNGKKYFFLNKTFIYEQIRYGRGKIKQFIYKPIKKEGRPQWEVYILDYNDPYYKGSR